MKIVDRMPYFTRRTEVNVRGENVAVKPYQIMVWISIGQPGELQWDARDQFMDLPQVYHRHEATPRTGRRP